MDVVIHMISWKDGKVWLRDIESYRHSFNLQICIKHLTI